MPGVSSALASTARQQYQATAERWGGRARPVPRAPLVRAARGGRMPARSRRGRRSRRSATHRTAEGAQQEHLRRPAADAAHRHEVVDDLLVPEAPDALELHLAETTLDARSTIAELFARLRPAAASCSGLAASTASARTSRPRHRRSGRGSPWPLAPPAAGRRSSAPGRRSAPVRALAGAPAESVALDEHAHARVQGTQRSGGRARGRQRRLRLSWPG